jgi:hypothetical protein
MGYGSSISREADFVGVVDRAWVVIRFATQEEHDAVLHIDAGVIVDSLSGIDDAVTDEDDLTLEIGGGGVKDREIVFTQLRGDQLVCCADANDRVGFDEWRGDHRGHDANGLFLTGHWRGEDDSLVVNER